MRGRKGTMIKAPPQIILIVSELMAKSRERMNRSSKLTLQTVGSYGSRKSINDTIRFPFQSDDELDS
jgi:hypothetical protein